MSHHISRGQLHSLTSSHYVEEIWNAKLRSLACLAKILLRLTKRRETDTFQQFNHQWQPEVVNYKLMLAIVIFLAEIHSVKLNSPF